MLFVIPTVGKGTLERFDDSFYRLAIMFVIVDFFERSGYSR